jgi:diguanylate cyclase (GGDEF)-like protein
MTPATEPGAEAAASIAVLLIEDDLVDEMATLRTIEREALPYRVQVARSIAEARAVLASRSFDVILADYQLPDGSSFDLMDVFADQLVIFVTGAWDEAAATRALRLGVHDYLIKDDDGRHLKLLHYRVETALRQRRIARQLRASEARLQAILDHAPASISAHDLNGRLILSNRQHAELAGAPGRPGQPAAPGPTPFESEETLTHRDGSQHTYLTVRFPMPGADGCNQGVGAISVDITARKKAEQQIRNLAYFDPLTGLPNRRLLLDRLQQALAGSARHGGHGALFFIDLDRFKALNDSLGHDHGDLLLIEVARRLLGCVRGEDTVARIGGDEFVVMTVGLAEPAGEAATQATAVGNKILAAIGRPCQLNAHRHTVTPSVGISLFHGREAAPDEIMKRADVAMYQAKGSGGGTLRFFDPEMQAALDSRVALGIDLGRALAGGQFGLHFQPQVDGRLGIVGAQALLRWHHPRCGLLLPDQFMPLAEQYGLILPIGKWVLDSVCALLGRWAADPHLCDLRLAVNVSARQFRQEGYASQVALALQSHGADPGHLRLELRESQIQDDPAQTRARMHALRDLGVGFAIDDFGISYSSLSHLKRLPLNQIKISQSLMPNLVQDPHDAAVVRTIVDIARNLKMDALAVGVENVEQKELLAELGCSLWQGQLFGAPAPLAEFEGLLGGPARAVAPGPALAPA